MPATPHQSKEAPSMNVEALAKEEAALAAQEAALLKELQAVEAERAALKQGAAAQRLVPTYTCRGEASGPRPPPVVLVGAEVCSLARTARCGGGVCAAAVVATEACIQELRQVADEELAPEARRPQNVLTLIQKGSRQLLVLCTRSRSQQPGCELEHST